MIFNGLDIPKLPNLSLERMLRLRTPFDKLRAGSRGPGC